MVHDGVGWLDVEVGVQKPRSRERVVSRQAGMAWHVSAVVAVALSCCFAE